MAKKPEIGAYYDDEEKALIESIEFDEDTNFESILTPERLEELKASARATINEKRTKITIRIPDYDLLRLKARAMREGMPYQTLINSILHKAVSRG